MGELRLEAGEVPWAPARGAKLKEGWHFYDHPRWGYFELEGELFAFHRHDNVGDWRDGPSLFTYRLLDDAGLRRLTVPQDQWGEPWGEIYRQWHRDTPARWWAVASADILLERSGAFSPPVADNLAWAERFARERGVDPSP